MVDKFTRMTKTLPSMYRAEVNTFVRGLLKAWGVSDDEVTVQIFNAKDQLFVAKAEARFLDFLGNNVGVPREAGLGIEDGDYRGLIPVLSFFPKQVRATIISLFDVFWGPSFTRANINSGNTETFNFGPVLALTGTANFSTGDKTVKGTGTAFTTELTVGDFIKPTAAPGNQYVKVAAILDDEMLELSVPWANAITIGTSMTTAPVKELEYEVDGRTRRVFRFKPNAFDDVTAVIIEELAAAVNSDPEHNDDLVGSVFIDPISGNKFNLRTSTPGLQGSIQIIGGTANDPTILDFATTVQTEVKTSVFETNPNEVIVKIPSSVPVLRRDLRGSAHPKEGKTIIFSNEEVFDFSGLGASSTLEVDVDGTPNTVTFTHASDFNDSSKVTNEEVAKVINAQLMFLQAFTKDPSSQKRVGLSTTEGSSEYQVTGGTANGVLGFVTTLQEDPDIITANFESSYVFDPVNQLFTVTGASSELNTKVEKGSVQTTIDLADASGFPNTPGQIIFNFGRSDQEGPVDYSSRPNNSTLLIDASKIFDNDHEVGRKVNFISGEAAIPRLTGEDFPVFIVGTEEAREAAQNLIRKLIASGVVIRFIIEFPEVLFQCDITAPTSPDFKGSLTGGTPLFSC